MLSKLLSKRYGDGNADVAFSSVCCVNPSDSKRLAALDLGKSQYDHSKCSYRFDVMRSSTRFEPFCVRW